MPAQRPRYAVRIADGVFVETVYLTATADRRRLSCAKATHEREAARKWTLHMAQAIARVNFGHVVT